MGKKYFITGGTGTLGKELVKQLYCSAERIVVYSRDEAKQAAMMKTFPEGGADGPMRYRIGDVRDYDRLKQAMEDCDTVIHTAAMKRIDTCEYNIFEAIKTNVEGSLNVVKAANSLGYEKAVLISTDKACNSCSTYGTTKSMAEKIFSNANNYGKCCSYSVRYGNVAGSRGAVHNIWKEAAESGKPINLTHPDMTRWFWSISEAAMFVMHTLPNAGRGVIYVPKMQAHKLYDLASKFSDNINITGLRCSEKLHEEMVSVTEATNTYETPEWYAIHPIQVDYATTNPRGILVPAGFTLTSNM